MGNNGNVVRIGFFWSLLIASAIESKPPPCDSNIYCYGPLLHMVQMSHIYSDDKTFVDQPLKYAPAEVYQNYTNFIQEHKPSDPTGLEIRQFVDDNFHPNGHEFERWTPVDWHEKPKFLLKIANEELRTWANTIHSLWKELGRSIKEDCKLRQERYSIIYVSHPFIIPGGRFREFYYWDSYWIQRGLLRSEMFTTVKGMIQNFMEMVDSIGFVPNGGRIYFRRSQPPLLISMMKSYFDATGDSEFLRSSMSTLEREFKFWFKHRMVTVYHKGEKYRVARYRSDRTGPRPEAYSGDYDLAYFLPTEKAKDELYTNLHSAAESGWDFSSRWFTPEENTGHRNKSATNTGNILPVDLQALLFLNAKTLSQFLKLLGNQEKAAIYSQVAEEFQQTIQNLFWDDELGSYFDYDFVNKGLIKNFYASSFFPLWAGVETTPQTLSRFLNYTSSLKVFDFLGGLPSSLNTTSEQWDMPNGWSPMNHIAIEALAKTGDETAHKYALQMADKWVRSNYKAFYDAAPHTMFEKYDVTRFGEPGGGGEYSVVAGFGWTNGVILDLLAEYGGVLTFSTPLSLAAVNRFYKSQFLIT